jgi:hypothetical protein
MNAEIIARALGGRKAGGGRNLGTGKPEFARVLKWQDKATADKFSTTVIKLFLARHRGALDAEEAS